MRFTKLPGKEKKIDKGLLWMKYFNMLDLSALNFNPPCVEQSYDVPWGIGRKRKQKRCCQRIVLGLNLLICNVIVIDAFRFFGADW